MTSGLDSYTECLMLLHDLKRHSGIAASVKLSWATQAIESTFSNDRAFNNTRSFDMRDINVLLLSQQMPFYYTSFNKHQVLQGTGWGQLKTDFSKASLVKIASGRMVCRKVRFYKTVKHQSSRDESKVEASWCGLEFIAISLFDHIKLMTGVKLTS